MTFAELTEAVRDALPPKTTFTISTTYRHGSDGARELEWCLFVLPRNDDSAQYTGATAEAVLAELTGSAANDLAAIGAPDEVMG